MSKGISQGMRGSAAVCMHVVSRVRPVHDVSQGVVGGGAVELCFLVFLSLVYGKQGGGFVVFTEC